jgi:hypothetical protein
MEKYATTTAVFCSGSAVCYNDSIGSQRGMRPHYEYLRAIHCHKKKTANKNHVTPVTSVKYI